MDLLQNLDWNSKRNIGRLITLVENKGDDYEKVVSKIYSSTGSAYVIGITGPPGAGKSTITDKLTKNLIEKGFKVGIIAVDPTSPFTGGSILGDRIRMNEIATEKNVFIRSMGTRGHLGGLSEATKAAISVLDFAGADFIFVETVGVGQSEVEIVKNSDTVLMVMVPGLGDDIQAMKAGIMEIGDVFAINKADKDGALRTKTEIEMMLSYNENEWNPPVSLVTAVKGEGIDTVIENITSHREYLKGSSVYEEKKKSVIEENLLEILREKITKKLLDSVNLDEYTERVYTREMDPYKACEIIMNNLKEA